MNRIARSLVVGVVLLLASSGPLWAQAGSTAQISGIVRDSSGGVLPGADVTATQTATGIVRSAVTNEAGVYTLPNLPTGPYRLEVSLSGFQAYARTGLELQVNDNPVINVTLPLGEITETITVEARTPIVETRTPGVSEVIESQRIVDLPLNGRNPTDLIAIIPTAVQQGSSSSRSFQGTMGGQAFSVGGGQGSSVAYVLDGAMHNNPYDNLNLPFPFPDALQEFRASTSTLTAQNGMHSGAAVNANTKAGTNRWHGNLFEFFRNHAFNATNPFAARNPDGTRKDDGLNRNQYGGTFGGPIQTDRMFFFVGYQGTNTRQTSSDNLAFVPTAQMLAGDFTAFASAACNSGTPITLRAPFVGNVTNPANFNPIALAIASRLPTSTDPCGAIRYERPVKQDETQWVGRVDYQWSDRQLLFARYIATTQKAEPPFTTSGNLLTTTQGGRDNLGQSLTFGSNLIVSSQTVNSFRVAANRTAIHRTHKGFFSAPSLGVNTFSYLPDYMLMSVQGGFNIGGGTENQSVFDTNAFQVTDDLTVVRGTHEIAFGGSIGFWTSYSSAHVRSPGVFSFARAATLGTNSGMGDFLTGQLNSFTQTAPNFLDMSQRYVGLYAQDTWRASPKVTLTYGVRWEPFLPQTLRNDAIYNFDVNKFLTNQISTVFVNAPAGFTYPGDPGFQGKTGMSRKWTTFAPRVGLAWDPRGDGRTSIRSSYGMAYDFVNGQFHINTAIAPPWGSQTVINRPPGGLNDPYAGQPGGNPFPKTFDQNAQFVRAGSFLVIDPDLTPPRMHSWNVVFQQQIGADWGASGTYLGSYSEHLWNPNAINPAVFGGQCSTNGAAPVNCASTTGNTNNRRTLTVQNPAQGQFIGGMDIFTDVATQTYHAMVLSLQRRAGRGISASTNYTLSSCEGLPTQVGGTPNVASGYTNPADPDLDYGNCNSLRRHSFNLSASAQTAQFSRPALRMALSDWRLSGILRSASGSRFSVTSGLDRAFNGQNGQRASSVAGQDPYGDRSSTSNYLNPAAFAQPAPGTFGDTKRNAYEGPGRTTVDLSLVRLFSVFGTRRMEVRAEAFNVMNTFVRNNPGSNLNQTATFGRITGAGDPRIVQFAVKFEF